MTNTPGLMTAKGLSDGIGGATPPSESAELAAVADQTAST